MKTICDYYEPMYGRGSEYRQCGYMATEFFMV